MWYVFYTSIFTVLLISCNDSNFFKKAAEEQEPAITLGPASLGDPSNGGGHDGGGDDGGGDDGGGCDDPHSNCPSDDEKFGKDDLDDEEKMKHFACKENNSKFGICHETNATLANGKPKFEYIEVNESSLAAHFAEPVKDDFGVECLSKEDDRKRDRKHFVCNCEEQ